VIGFRRIPQLGDMRHLLSSFFVGEQVVPIEILKWLFAATSIPTLLIAQAGVECKIGLRDLRVSKRSWSRGPLSKLTEVITPRTIKGLPKGRSTFRRFATLIRLEC
jgi:hypothetical protein